MKQRFLQKLSLLAIMLMVGVSSAWAQEQKTYSGTVTSNSGSPSNPFTLNSVNWSYKTTAGAGSPTTVFGTAYSNKCIKFGAGKANCYGSVTLSTDYFNTNSFVVKEVEVNAIGSAKKDVTMAIGSNNTTKEIPADAWTTIGLDGLNIMGSDLEITFTIDAAGFFVNYIKVTYVEAGETYTVSFNSNGGSGSMASVTDIRGAYSLPACSFTAPDGKEFVGWKADNAGALISEGTNYNVVNDVCFYAQWITIGAALPGTYSFGTDWATDFDIVQDGSASVKANDVDWNANKNAITLNVKNGSSTNSYVKTSDFRAYNGYTLTFSVPTGYVITTIEMAKGGKTISEITPNVGILKIADDKSSATWTGASKSVVLSVGTTVGFSTIDVTFADEKDVNTSVTVSDKKYATACFDKNVIVPADNTVFYVMDVDGTTVTLDAIAKDEIIKAGIGVLVYKAEAGKVEFIATDATATFDESDIDADECLVGMSASGETVNGVVGTANNYILSVDTEDKFAFCAPKNGSFVTEKGKAYLHVVGASAAKFEIALNDETTGIDKVDVNGQQSTDAIFNLAGQKVGADYKGIIIVNGKKMLNK